MFDNEGKCSNNKGHKADDVHLLAFSFFIHGQVLGSEPQKKDSWNC